MPKKMPFEYYVGDLEKVASYYARKCFYADFEDVKQEMLVVCWESYLRWKPNGDASLKTFAATRCSQYWKNYVSIRSRHEKKGQIKKFCRDSEKVLKVLQCEEKSFDRILVKMMLDRFEVHLRSIAKRGNVLDRRTLELFKLLRKGWTRTMIKNKWGTDGAVTYILFKDRIRKPFTNLVGVL
jgi:hypothetical protein